MPIQPQNNLTPAKIKKTQFDNLGKIHFPPLIVIYPSSNEKMLRACSGGPYYEEETAPTPPSLLNDKLFVNQC